jgi:hypothetical protein
VFAQQQQALLAACYVRDIETVTLLLQLGLNPRARNSEALVALCASDLNPLRALDIARELLALGCDVNTNLRGLRFSEPLEMALLYDQAELATFLVRRGARMRARDSVVALSRAIYMGAIGVVESLLDAGASARSAQFVNAVISPFREEILARGRVWYDDRVYLNSVLVADALSGDEANIGDLGVYVHADPRVFFALVRAVEFFGYEATRARLQALASTYRTVVASARGRRGMEGRVVDSILELTGIPGPNLAYLMREGEEESFLFEF